jgi:CO/xanthine dehydrogenase Mo-binding subunit
LPTPDLNLNGTRVLWRLDVAFVRSSVAHGRIRHLHIPDQHRHAVFTAKDLGDVKPIAAAAALSGFKHCREPILAVDKVRYVGELIAAIRVLHMETPSPHTEFGVKGIGEGGAVGPRCCNSQRRE